MYIYVEVWPFSEPFACGGVADSEPFACGGAYAKG